jgi:hypothetical protein
VRISDGRTEPAPTGIVAAQSSLGQEVIKPTVFPS